MGNVKETNNYPSSLSYFLPKRGKLHLQLYPAESERPAVDANKPPFTLINGQDPLARIFRGAFVTDYGSVIKEVNLLIQRDTVALSAVIDTILTNSIIDQYWQQALLIRQDRVPGHSMLLADQVDNQGLLLPFAPLLFCRKRSLFFEPPCSRCGSILQLCKNDTRLEAAGLQLYTTSTQRYLYCPSCYQADKEQIWHTFQRKADDPVVVQDCKQLIESFSQLDFNFGKNVDFPCLACQQRNSCYGAQNEAFDAIFVLSFYPFYMLITERDSLDGFQFLAMKLHNQSLVNGAEERTSGSIHEDLDTAIVRKHDGNDPAICNLLQKLGRKWHQELQGQRLAGQQLSPHDDAETLSLQVDQNNFQKDDLLSDPTVPPTTKNDESSNDVSTETIIMTSPTSHPLEDLQTHLAETVLLSSTPPASSTPIEQEELDNQKIAEKRKPEDQEYDLTETVILKPDKKP